MFFFSDLPCTAWKAFLPGELLSLLRGDLSRLAPGKNILIPDKLWINRFDARILTADQREWEAHRDFADLQMVLEGEEFCFLAEAEKCVSVRAYHAADDCEMFMPRGSDFQKILLSPGSALFIPPPLVHLPDVATSAFSGSAPKLVAKIHRSLLFP